MNHKEKAVASGAFLNYIGKAPDMDVAKALRKNTKAFKKLIRKIPAKKRDYAYGPDKWTIREVIQHLIDAERVFSYRALRIARQDATPMAGFDENTWAQAANKTRKDWNDLVEEFLSLRYSVEFMFASFGEEELSFVGMASERSINALALGYVMAGHVQHHLMIIEERYL